MQKWPTFANQHSAELDTVPEAGQKAGPPAAGAAHREGAWGATARPRTASRRLAARAGHLTAGGAQSQGKLFLASWAARRPQGCDGCVPVGGR